MDNYLGKILKDLSLKPGNPRNSEGAFLTLVNGEIIFIYSKFKGESCSDHATADICIMRSQDEGETFGNDEVIFTCEDENAKNIMSLSLLHMLNGDIGIFYLVRTTYSLMRMYMRRSNDNGRTWSERVLCTPQEGFFVVNNDRVLRLSDNSIIIPVATHRKGFCDNQDEAGDGFVDSRSDVIYFISKDDGYTWKAAPGKCSMPYLTYCTSGLQEPGVIELKPDILWSWARTDIGRQYEMFSFDNGQNWTSPQPSRFTSPNSPLSMRRGPDNIIYAIWNPVPLYNGRSHCVDDVWTGGRTPMVIAVSYDNGKAFSEPLAIETDKGSGFCYCAIHFTKDSILLAYCAGGKDDLSCLTRTRMRKIKLAGLLDEIQKLKD